MSETITPKVGIGILLFRRNPDFPDNTTLQILVGKRLSDHGKGEWSLPGGHVEMMEDLGFACFREVEEETGILIDVHPKPFRAFPYSSDRFWGSGKHYITLFFLGKVVGGELENKEPEKCEGWEWVDIDKIPEPIFPPLKKMIESKAFDSLLL